MTRRSLGSVANFYIVLYCRTDVRQNDSQLAELLPKLDRRDVDYWLDSGTLLGFIRDGSLLESDGDIDLSTFLSEYEPVREVVESLSGYSCKYRNFNGQVHVIKIKSDNYERKIDIKFFAKSSQHLISPVRLPIRNNYSSNHPMRYGFGLVRTLIDKIYYKHQIFTPDIGSVFAGNRTTHNVGWWIIPKELVGTPAYNNDIGGKVPSQTEEYLRYRYGEWKTPTDEWIWHVDDGAIVEQLPTDTVQEATSLQVNWV